MNKKTKKKPPKIIINYSWCKNCGICIAFCPRGVYTADELGAPVISHPEKCINCHLCVLRCPDFAVELKEEGAEPDEE